MTAAILAGVIIPAEDLFPGEFDVGPGAFNHSVQTDYGWQWKCLRNGMNHAPPIQDQRRFFSQDHIDRPVGRRDIDWLKIRVQDKDRFIHQITIMIITVLIFLLRVKSHLEVEKIFKISKLFIICS